MQDLEDYVSSFREGEKIYYLNKEGRERVDCSKVRKKTAQARHWLMRNDLYIAMGQPSTWKNEMRFGIKDVASLVVDATFIKDKIMHVVEVDHKQKMSKNRTKIEKLKKIQEKKYFKLIWVTTTEYRRKQLEKLCDGIDCTVFTTKDLY